METVLSGTRVRRPRKKKTTRGRRQSSASLEADAREARAAVRAAMAAERERKAAPPAEAAAGGLEGADAASKPPASSPTKEPSSSAAPEVTAPSSPTPKAVDAAHEPASKPTEAPSPAASSPAESIKTSATSSPPELPKASSKQTSAPETSKPSTPPPAPSKPPPAPSSSSPAPTPSSPGPNHKAEDWDVSASRECTPNAALQLLTVILLVAGVYAMSVFAGPKLPLTVMAALVLVYMVRMVRGSCVETKRSRPGRTVWKFERVSSGFFGSKFGRFFFGDVRYKPVVRKTTSQGKRNAYLRAASRGNIINVVLLVVVGVLCCGFAACSLFSGLSLQNGGSGLDAVFVAPDGLLEGIFRLSSWSYFISYLLVAVVMTGVGLLAILVAVLLQCGLLVATFGLYLGDLRGMLLGCCASLVAYRASVIIDYCCAAARIIYASPMLWVLAIFFAFWTSPDGKGLRSYISERSSISGWRPVLRFATAALLLINYLPGSDEFKWIAFDKITVMPSWPVLVVYALLHFVLPLLASTNSQLFLGASIACGFVPLKKVALGLFLGFVDLHVGLAVGAVLCVFAAFVGRILGSRVAFTVSEWAPCVCSTVCVVLGLLDGWRDSYTVYTETYTWKMLSSVSSTPWLWIGSVVSWEIVLIVLVAALRSQGSPRNVRVAPEDGLRTSSGPAVQTPGRGGVRWRIVMVCVVAYVFTLFPHHALAILCPLVLCVALSALYLKWVLRRARQALRVALVEVLSAASGATAPSASSDDASPDLLDHPTVTAHSGTDCGAVGKLGSRSSAWYAFATLLVALCIYGFVLWWSGSLSTMLVTVGTAPNAQAGTTAATATIFTLGTSVVVSPNVYTVFSVAAGLVGLALVMFGVLRVRTDAQPACSSSSNASPHVPNTVPGAFAFNTCTDACCGAAPSCDFTKPAPPLHELSLRTKLWLIGVSITGKAVDYDACPDGPEVGRSLLKGVLLGGGKKRKKTEHCKRCDGWFTPQGFPKHNCVGEGRPDPTLAPRGFTNDPKCCPICSKLEGGAKKKGGYGTCSFWGKSGHLGSDNVEEYRAANNKKSHASRNEFYDQEKQQGLSGRKVTEEQIDWESSFCHGDLSETLAAAVRRFTDATPDWRNDAKFLQRLAAHLFDMDSLGDDKKKRLAGPHGLIYQQCTDENPLKPNTLPRADKCSIEYHHLAELVETLLGKGDAGKLALLKLLVASKLLAALEPLMNATMRKLFDASRTNARGASCSKKLDHQTKSHCEGPLRLRKLVLELAGLKFESDGGDNQGFARSWQWQGPFGLRTSKADLIRLTERLAYVCQMLTPEQGSRPGCDFGTLYALAQLFQGFAVKLEDEALAGNTWHRETNHEQSASMGEVVDYLLGRVAAGLPISSTFDLEVMLDLGRVVLFKNLDASNLQASFADVLQFFSETYDTISSRKTDVAYATRARQAVNGRSASEGCWEGIPTALDGFDMAYRIGGLVFGHDVFGEDPRDAEIIVALAKNLERLCKGIPWDVSMIPGRAWGDDERKKLRERLLTELMPWADRASKIFHVEFERQIAAAGDNIDAVLAAVSKGWEVMTEGLDVDRANYFYENDKVFFRDHAPRLLTGLQAKRVVRVVTHDLSMSNWRENGVETVRGLDRIGYEFGRVVPTPAPAAGGALKPANSPKKPSPKRRRV